MAEALEKILFLGTKGQVMDVQEWIDSNFTGKCPIKGIEEFALIRMFREAEVRHWCVYKHEGLGLENGIVGSTDPEIKSTWKLPDRVLYTGMLRDYEGHSADSSLTRECSNQIEELLKKYNIQNYAKVDVERHM
jgi:hypothetical protein